MAPLGQKCLLSLLVIVATAAALPLRRSQSVAAPAPAAAPKENDKLAAVDKVISMLEKLQAKVNATKEEEAYSFFKFNRFCEETTAEKEEAIRVAEDAIATLEAKIQATVVRLGELDTAIATAISDIKATELKMSEAETSRAEMQKEYEKNAADLVGAKEAIANALAALKASKAPSLMQMQKAAQTVRTAVQLADALGLRGSAAALAELPHMALLQDGQAPEVQMENYKFHSDSVIEILESLQKDFWEKKNEVDEQEVADIHSHETLMQQWTYERDALEKELGELREEKAAKEAELAADREELATVQKALAADQQYLRELKVMCSNTQKTFVQRKQVLEEELVALDGALAIIKSQVAGNTTAYTVRFAQLGMSLRGAAARAADPAAMEAAEAEAEAAEAAPSFLQRSSSRAGPDSDGREAAAALLREQGEKLHSALLTSLAGRVSASDDPFGKVKQLIQELLERLLQEEGNEANHKGWCTKAMTDAEQRRNYAADALERLNSEMAALEARRGTLTETSDTLGTEIGELTKERAKAIADRAAEKAQNEAIILDGKEGLGALSMAQEILSKYYGSKEKKVDLELDKVSVPAPSPAVVLPDGMSPMDHAPDMPFKIGETYHGDQSTYTGIEGMLEVMASDFQRTMDETARLEAEAQREHVLFLTEIESALAQKKTAKQETDTQLQSANEIYDEAKGNLHTESGSLKTAISELLDLKPVCVDTGMTYQERVARREDEIAALQKALCILGDYMGKGEGC